MSKQYGLCVFVGRFMPFHNGHLGALEQALEMADNVVVCLGSHKQARNAKNPFTTYERQEFILGAVKVGDHKRIHFINVKDNPSDNNWFAEVQLKVNYVANKLSIEKPVAIIGHNKDGSSFYLQGFPQWDFIDSGKVDDLIHATDIRRFYFEGKEDWKTYVPKSTQEFLESFAYSESFERLKKEYDYIEDHYRAWSSAPYSPVFVTVDNIVFQAGHVLVIRRKGGLGNGLLALPGGFIDVQETLQESALRELYEETKIEIPVDTLKLCIKGSFVQDNPARSLCGRRISHCYYYQLPFSRELPVVNGSDDASHAFWLPLTEVAELESEFFEDHSEILSKAIAKLQ